MGQRMIPDSNSEDIGIVIKSSSLKIKDQIYMPAIYIIVKALQANNRIVRNLLVAYQIFCSETVNDLVPDQDKLGHTIFLAVRALEKKESERLFYAELKYSPAHK